MKCVECECKNLWKQNLTPSIGWTFIYSTIILWPCPRHMEVPRPGNFLNPSCSCNLHHSYGNTSSFNPLHWARDWTCTSAVAWATAVRFLTYCATVETPLSSHLFNISFFLYKGWISVNFLYAHYHTFRINRAYAIKGFTSP